MRIGVDLGGTKIEALVLDEDGTEFMRRRTATPVGSYDRTVRAITDLVEALEATTGQRGSVGVGIPGTVSPATGLVKNANSTCLIGHPLDRDLSQALDRPVRLANDANCFAISEAIDGAAAGARVVFGVILGTGVGGGLVVDGIGIHGPNAIAGEWGHNPLPWPGDEERPGPSCWCGKQGCIETFLCGPGLARDHATVSGEALTPAEISAAAAAGNPAAEATLVRYEDRLARALATILNVVDPDAVVLGGGLSNLQRLYKAIPELWSRHTFSDQIETPLVPPVHGDSSGVRGAAWLWPPNRGRPAP